MEFIDIIKGLTPVEAFLVGGIFLYLVIKGVIKLPKWIQLKKSGKSIHSTCVHFPSLKLLVTDVLEKSAKIQKILINETISEQMNEGDDLFIDIRDSLKSNYLTLYKEYKKGDKAGLMQENDVLSYIAILNNTESLLKGMTRRFMKKNHFLKKSDSEFRIYVKERTEDYQKALSTYLDEHYSSNRFKVSRELLYESNMKVCFPWIADKAENFFYRVRDIAQSKREKVEKLRTEIGDSL